MMRSVSARKDGISLANGANLPSFWFQTHFRKKDMGRDQTNFDWTDLNTFLHVARKGTIGAAAEVLRLDVTTVRRRLAALEEATGITLFVKSGRLLHLTAEGERIHSIASQMNDLGNAIARDATDAARELAGVVRVSTMEGFGSFYLGARLCRLVNRHPQLKIQLVNAQHVLNLSEREADVSINMVSPERGRLVVRKVGQFTVGLYGAPAYLLSASQGGGSSSWRRGGSFPWRATRLTQGPAKRH